MTNMKKTLLRGGCIVSIDRSIGILPAGDLLIIGDKIAAVTSRVEATADEVIDTQGKILIPGLVNAHLHTWQSGLRSIGGGWTGPDYHRLMHANMATRFRPDDNYIGTLFGALDQLNGGVTTILDWCHDITSIEHAYRSVDALQEAGVRAVFAHGTAKPAAATGEVPFTHIPHPRARLEALRRDRFSSDDGLITLGAALLGPQFSSEEVTEHDFRMARELDLLSTTHASRRPADRIAAEGYRLPARLGLLDRKHNVVHANYLDDEELRIVVEHGASVTVTASLELHVHSGDPVTGRLRALGALPSIGVDSICCANSDMFSEMRFAMLFQRALEHRANAARGRPPLTVLPVPSQDALEWATIGGARALCLEDRIGSLTPGKKADVVVLDATALNMFPVHEPIQTVVQQANLSNVEAVFVDGEVRKREGRLLYSDTVLARRRDELVGSVERIKREAGRT